MTTRTTWLTGSAVAAAVIFGPGLVQQGQLWVRQRAVDRELRRLEASHRALLEERERLTSDPVYVEDLVRSTFKVAKPGELVVPLDDERFGKPHPD